MTGSGFRVDTDGIRGAAAGFARSGDRVAAAKGVLEGTPLPKDAFGRHGPGPSLAAAVEGAVNGHLERTAARLNRLRELADKLGAAADEYDRTEDEQRDTIDKVSRRDEGTGR